MQVILLRPASSSVASHRTIEHHFKKACCVRRQVVLNWLHHLSCNHPDYQHIKLSMQNLHTLPVDESVHTLLPTHSINEMFNNEFNGPLTSDLNDALNTALNDLLNNALNDEINLEPHKVEVPDFHEDETELQHLQQAVQSASPALSITLFCQTLLSEWKKKCVFQMAFPSLFSCRLGDFFKPHTHEITFKDWISHVLQYKDERFTYHSCFCYVAFNMWMHYKSKKSASYLCKQLNGQPVTLDMLQEQVYVGNSSLFNQIS